MSTTEPLKISVVTVSYNAAATIETTIRSVLDQTYDNIEYIIIDGASTDSTPEIVNRLRATHPNGARITHFTSEPDRGIYDAMNKGIAAATGHYIYFLGADDTLYSASVLSKVASTIDIDREKIYYGNVMFKESGQIYRGEVKSPYSLCLSNISHQALFYPISVYKTKNFDTRYKLLADYVYNMELYSTNRSSFCYINEIIALYSLAGQSSTNCDKLFEQNRVALVFRLFGPIVGSYVWLRIKLANFRKFIIRN